jgi:hypothetical protein
VAVREGDLVAELPGLGRGGVGEFLDAGEAVGQRGGPAVGAEPRSCSLLRFSAYGTESPAS